MSMFDDRRLAPTGDTVGQEVVTDLVVKPLTAGLWVALIMSVIERTGKARIPVVLFLLLLGTYYIYRSKVEEN